MEPKARRGIDQNLLKHSEHLRKLLLILGLLPLEFKANGLGISTPGLVCTLLMASSLLVCLSAQLYLLRNDPYSTDAAGDSSFKSFISYLDYGSLNAAITVHLWTVIRRRDQLFFVIRTISGVKSYLDLCGFLWKPSRRFWGSVAQGLFYLSIAFIDPITYNFSLFGITNTLAYYYLVEVLIWTSTYFMWFTDSIAEGFRGLSERLHQAATPGDIEFLIKRHYLLTEASHKLNETCCLGLSLVFACSFSMSVSTSYEVLATVINGSALNSTLTLFFWVVTLLLLQFRVVNSCVRVTYQASSFDNALYKLLVYKSPSSITQESSTLKLFFHYTAKTEVGFKLFGFFTLDWQRFFSMLAAGCTYLIIIVQMKQLA